MPEVDGSGKVWELLREAGRTLESAGVPDAGYDARCLFEAAFDLSREKALSDWGSGLLELVPERAERAARLSLFFSYIERRKSREPLQQILGQCWFYGLPFFVNRHVLCPRADTEILVEEALRLLKSMRGGGRKALDLCAGSGCIGISLASDYGLDYMNVLEIWASDVSSEALAVAERNARELLPKHYRIVSGLDGRAVPTGGSLYGELGRRECAPIDEPVCPTGGSSCQNSEWKKTTPIDEPVCPTGGSSSQNSEWKKTTPIDEPACPTGGSSCQNSEWKKLDKDKNNNKNGDGGDKEVGSRRGRQDGGWALFRLLQSNLFEDIPPYDAAISESGFDMILCNPPYIESGTIRALDPEVRDFEPRIALDGGEDGFLFYRRIADQAARYLRPGGWILLENGFGQGDDVLKLLKEHGFGELRIIPDLSGKDRVSIGQKVPDV